jgi:Omp85 superfamily domain
MSKLSIVWLIFLCHLAGLDGRNHAASAQNRPFCHDDRIIEADGFTVRAIEIKGKWVPRSLQAKVEQIIGVGQIYSPTVAARARNIIKAELKQQAQIDLNNDVAAVSYLDMGICNVSDATHPKQVEVVFYPYFVQVDLVNIGDRLLPISTINTPTFSAQIRSPFLTTSPAIGISIDRNYGKSLSLKTTTNLLSRSTDRNINSNQKPDALNFDFDARRSLERPFYNVNAGIEYARPDYTGAMSQNLAVRYSNQFDPLGEGANWRERVQIEGGINQKLDRSLIKSYTAGGSVRLVNNSYTPRNSDSSNNSETGFKLYAIGDSRMGDGFARFGAWLDGGFPSKSNSYQRLAIQGGYTTEIGDGHNTIGLEVMAGSGYAWGNPPEYGRFFGGSAAANFLSEPLNSTSVKAFPLGPTLRSYGEQQAGLRGANGLVSGGNFYWNLNLNLTFPIAAWSQPLIPNEVVVDPETDEPILLSVLAKQFAVGAMRSSLPVIKQDLIRRGYPDNEATTTIARKVFDNDIVPTINYLFDRANLYSVKPMLLFDVAQLSGGDGLGSNTRAAVGGGLQLNIVNGRLETGYLHTIAPATDSSNGNFFLRFLFQDFF